MDNLILDNIGHVVSWYPLWCSIPAAMTVWGLSKRLLGPRRGAHGQPQRLPAHRLSRRPRLPTPQPQGEAAHAPAQERYRLRLLRATRDIESGQQVEVELLEPGLKLSAAVKKVAASCLTLRLLPGQPAIRAHIVGSRAMVRFTRDDDGRYGFATRVLRASMAPAGMMWLSHARQLERIQSRRYLRVRMAKPVSFTITSETNLLVSMLLGRSLSNSETRIGRLVDLSGGGCALRTNMPAPAGSFILMCLDIFGDGLIHIPGQVVDVSEQDSAHGVQHLAHIEFRHIPDELRQQIIQFVFSRQLCVARQ